METAEQCFEAANKLLQNRGSIAEVRSLVERSIQLNPEWGPPYVLYGQLLLLTAQHRASHIKKAELFLQRGVQYAPALPDAHYYLGVSIKHQGRAADAVPHFSTAVQLRPDWAEGHYDLGHALAEAERYDEARKHFMRCLEIDAEHPGATDALKDVMNVLKKDAAKRTFARWPRKLTDLTDIEAAVRKYVVGDGVFPQILSEDSKTVTLGSCFAANVSHALQANGYHAHNVTLGEQINSTFGNRYFLDWVLGRDTGPQVEQAGRIMGGEPGAIRASFEQADLVIFTLGVAPSFFDKKTGAFHFPKSEGVHFNGLTKDYDFRTTTVKENADNVNYILASIRELNPDITAVLTVSPVPLAASFEMPSAFIADCLSKSTLRVTAHDVVRQNSDFVYYWPAFEAVRWLGAYVGPVYGAEDQTTMHVSEEIIAIITRLFIEAFGGDTTTA